MQQLSKSDFKNIRNCLSAAISRNCFTDKELEQINQHHLIEKLDNIIKMFEQILNKQKEETKDDN